MTACAYCGHDESVHAMTGACMALDDMESEHTLCDCGREENASVEVARFGSKIWLTIRSEQSVGKSIALSTFDAEEVATMLQRSARSRLRRIKDEPQA